MNGRKIDCRSGAVLLAGAARIALPRTVAQCAGASHYGIAAGGMYVETQLCITSMCCTTCWLATVRCQCRAVTDTPKPLSQRRRDTCVGATLRRQPAVTFTDSKSGVCLRSPAACNQRRSREWQTALPLFDHQHIARETLRPHKRSVLRVRTRFARDPRVGSARPRSLSCSRSEYVLLGAERTPTYVPFARSQPVLRPYEQELSPAGI